MSRPHTASDRGLDLTRPELGDSGQFTSADLRAWRQARRLSQTELATQLGVTVRAVGRWERGERAIPAMLPLALQGLEREQTKQEAR